MKLERGQEVDIYSILDESYDLGFRIKGTYLHGKMQDDYQHDIFSFAEDMSDLEPGEYTIYINGKLCVFFFWNPEDWKGQTVGLIVYGRDYEYHNHAKNLYEIKSVSV